MYYTNKYVGTIINEINTYANINYRKSVKKIINYVILYVYQKKK